jgi:hypothetical protein
VPVLSRPDRLAGERLRRDLATLEAIAERLAHPQSRAEARLAAGLRVDLGLLRRVADGLELALATARDDAPGARARTYDRPAVRSGRRSDPTASAALGRDPIGDTAAELHGDLLALHAAVERLAAAVA